MKYSTLTLFAVLIALTACAGVDANQAKAKKRDPNSITRSEPSARVYEIQKMTPNEQEILREKLQDAMKDATPGSN